MSQRNPQKPSRCGRFARSESGTQLVELAIVLPLLLVLFGAVAEFGRFFYTYQTLTKATRAGARYLTTESSLSDDEAANLAVFGNTTGTGEPVVEGLTPSHVLVTRDGGANPAQPEFVTVSIGFTYEPLFDLGKLLGKEGLSLNVEVNPSTKMRIHTSLPS